MEEENKIIAPGLDPSLKAVIDRIAPLIKKRSLGQEIATFKEEIVKKPKDPEQLVMAFLPHQMAKTSVFFPMSKREMKEENRKISKLEQKTPWGKITIEGIKLSITEEDIFLALIKIAKENISLIQGCYILETNMKEIIHLLYGRSGYTEQSYKRIEEALHHFQLVRFELTTGTWKKKGSERLKVEKVRSIGNIVQSYTYEEKTRNLTIKFNPDFFAYFLESMLTNINYTVRRKLKKDGSKALLRFLSTHNNPSRMHILTVLNAINYNITQPLYRLRSILKTYIQELKKLKILGPKTKMFKDDTVYFDICESQKTLTKGTKQAARL